MGRPTRLSKRIITEICSAVMAGNYFEVSAAYAGVPKSTFYDWLKKGNKAIEGKRHNIYRELVDQLQEARAQAEVRHVAIIAKAAETRWVAAAWWLERTNPDRWGQRPRADTPKASDVPINITFTNVKGVSIDDAMANVEPNGVIKNGGCNGNKDNGSSE